MATAAAPSAREPLLLVCLQDPFDSANWIHFSDSRVPCADGKSTHIWQLRAGFELLPPRMLEGWASASPVTLSFKGFAQASAADNSHWTTESRVESSVTPPLRLVVRLTNAGKIEFSLAYAATHPSGVPLAFRSDDRTLNMDVAFATNGNSGITVAAVAVLSALPWAHLIAGSDAAIEGLAFSSGWRKNLAKPSATTVADGATTAQGSWGFAAMSRAEYEAWCTAEGRMPAYL